MSRTLTSKSISRLFSYFCYNWLQVVLLTPSLVLLVRVDTMDVEWSLSMDGLTETMVGVTFYHGRFDTNSVHQRRRTTRVKK